MTYGMRIGIVMAIFLTFAGTAAATGLSVSGAATQANDIKSNVGTDGATPTAQGAANAATDAASSVKAQTPDTRIVGDASGSAMGDAGVKTDGHSAHLSTAVAAKGTLEGSVTTAHHATGDVSGSASTDGSGSVGASSNSTGNGGFLGWIGAQFHAMFTGVANVVAKLDGSAGGDVAGTAGADVGVTDAGDASVQVTNGVTSSVKGTLGDVPSAFSGDATGQLTSTASGAVHALG